MKEIILLFCLMSSVASAQTAQVLMKISFTNASGIVETKTAILENWTAEFNGNNWVATITHSVFGTNGILTLGRLVASEADIEASDPYRGLILTDPSTNKWVIGLDTNGILTTTQITFSPEMSFSNRVDAIKQVHERVRKTRKNWNSSGLLQQRLEQVEKLLGLRELDD